MVASKSLTPDELTILGSSLVNKKGVSTGSHIINQYVNRDNPNGLEFSVLPKPNKRGPVHMELAKDEYEDLLLMMIIKDFKDDMPFSLVESESSRAIVNFLKDNALNISRATMRKRLNVMYENKFQTLKEKLEQKYRQGLNYH